MAKARKPTKSRSKAQSQPVISPVIIGIVAVAALLIVTGLIWLGSQPKSVSGSIDVSQFPMRGEANAPVTFIEYSDYG